MSGARTCDQRPVLCLVARSGGRTTENRHSVSPSVQHRNSCTEKVVSPGFTHLEFLRVADSARVCNPPRMSDQQPPQNTPTPPRGSTSGLAVASMVLGILWLFWIGSILAVIFGHVSLSQTRKDPSIGGRGMAIAGLTLGWVGVGILLITLIAN